MAGLNGTNPPTQQPAATPAPATAIPQDLKSIAQTSIDDIVEGAFNPNVGGNTQVPLGDNKNLLPQNQGQPQTQPQTINVQDVFKELDDLDRDIDEAQLEGAKSPESLRSFDGLKARYKNKIAATRNQLSNLETQNTLLAEQLKDLPKLKEAATKFEEVTPTVRQLEQKVEELSKENQTLSYFRRRYDLDSDPYIQQQFIQPMEEAKSKALDILKHSNHGEQTWEKLIDSDSEFKLNSLIDSIGISGMNAQSLKRFVNVHNQLESDYQEASSPESIEAAIDVAKGKRLQAIAQASKEIFDATKTAFGTWMEEIKESEFNKEHNIYVHDRVAEQAEINYEALKKMLPQDHISKGMLHSLSKASIVSAAYPIQKQMLDKALKIIAELQAERKNSGHSIKQIRESNPRGGSIQSIEELKQSSNKSIEDIARDTFANPQI